MEQSFSILVFDQDDPSTFNNVTGAIQEYQSELTSRARKEFTAGS
jgi:hypothetical protein